MLSSISGVLVSEGIGVAWIGDATVWQIAEGALPDQPDSVIALFEYGGETPDLHTNLEYPRLQVRTRSTDYDQARAKCFAAYNALHGLAEQVLDSTRYLLLSAIAAPESLGRDSERRYEFVCNFRVMKERELPT